MSKKSRQKQQLSRKMMKYMMMKPFKKQRYNNIFKRLMP